MGFTGRAFVYAEGSLSKTGIHSSQPVGRALAIGQRPLRLQIFNRKIL